MNYIFNRTILLSFVCFVPYIFRLNKKQTNKQKTIFSLDVFHIINTYAKHRNIGVQCMHFFHYYTCFTTLPS